MPDAHSPEWSRDGEWLAFVGEDGIFIVGRGSQEPRQIVEETCVLSPPSWSPDGQWIVYSCPSEIYKVNVDTGEVTRIFDSGCCPLWRWNNHEQ